MNIDVFSFLSSALDKVIPDASERISAKTRLLELQASGDLKTLEASMAAILAEASSEHKYVALARPTFLYVIYVFILASLPMGVWYAVDPISAGNMATGVKAWLESIPEAYIQLFGVGYLGYTGARSFDKRGKK